MSQTDRVRRNAKHTARNAGYETRPQRGKNGWLGAKAGIDVPLLSLRTTRNCTRGAGRELRIVRGDRIAPTLGRFAVRRLLVSVAVSSLFAVAAAVSASARAVVRGRAGALSRQRLHGRRRRNSTSPTAPRSTSSTSRWSRSSSTSTHPRATRSTTARDRVGARRQLLLPQQDVTRAVDEATQFALKGTSTSPSTTGSRTRDAFPVAAAPV